MKTLLRACTVAAALAVIPLGPSAAQQPATTLDTASVATLLDASRERNERVREPADREIRRRGAALIPALDSVIASGDMSQREAAAAALVQIGLPALTSIRAAARDTGMLGHAMMEALDAAMRADSAAISIAIPLLGDSNSVVRARVVRALPTYSGDVGRGGALAVAALSDPDPQVRSAAAYKVLEVHDSATSVRAIPLLVTLLDDTSALVRGDAVYSLGNMGPLDTAQIGAIVRRMQSDPDTGIRFLAARVLGWHGPEASSAVPALLTRLHDPLSSVRLESLGSLGEIGVSRLSKPVADTVIAVLRVRLSSPDSATRATAVGGLARIGAPAVAALSQALSSPDSLVAAKAANGMGMLATDSAVIKPLLHALGDKRGSVRRAAANALGGLEINVSAQLRAAARSPDASTRKGAERALHVRAVAESLPIARQCYVLEYGKWEIPDTAKSQEWGPSPKYLRFATVVLWERRNSLEFAVERWREGMWFKTGYWVPNAVRREVRVNASPDFSGKVLTLRVQSNGELHGFIETYWDFQPSTTQRAPVVARPIDCRSTKPIPGTPAAH